MMRKPRLLQTSLLVGIALLFLLGGCSAQERTQSFDEIARDIDRSLMCPLCPGQTIDQSNSELSAQMRAIVREKLAQGETKEEILQFFVERYGESVLAVPAKSGFNLIAWVTPFIGMVIGGVILWFALRKWTRRGKQLSPETVTSTPNSADDEKYRKRVEKELKDFKESGFR